MGVIMMSEATGRPIAKPYKKAELLIFNMWKGRTVVTTMFPNKDIICPITNREKFLFQSLLFVCSICHSPFNFYLSFNLDKFIIKSMLRIESRRSLKGENIYEKKR